MNDQYNYQIRVQKIISSSETIFKAVAHVDSHRYLNGAWITERHDMVEVWGSSQPDAQTKMQQVIKTWIQDQRNKLNP